MAGGPFAANVQCGYCGGVADRYYNGSEDDHYLCRDCGKQFFICWEREDALPTKLFHPEVRKVEPPPSPGPGAQPAPVDLLDLARNTRVFVVWRWIEKEDNWGNDVTHSAPVALCRTEAGARAEFDRRGGGKNHQVTGPLNLFALVKESFVPMAAARELIERVDLIDLKHDGVTFPWHAPGSYRNTLTSAPLSDDEMRRAARTWVWTVYYEDRFHSGSGRECYAVAICLSKAEADAELQRQGRPVESGGDGYLVQGPNPLIREGESTPSIGADTVRELFKRLDAGQSGPISVR